MSSRYVVDAHALIWYLEGNVKLGSVARQVLDDVSSDLVLPIIALAEAAFVVSKRRTLIPDVLALFDRVKGDPRLEVYPLTFEILRMSGAAEAVPEMHDRLIIASGLHLKSLGHEVSILTKDASIITSALLPVIWS